MNVRVCMTWEEEGVVWYGQNSSMILKDTERLWDTLQDPWLNVEIREPFQVGQTKNGSNQIRNGSWQVGWIANGGDCDLDLGGGWPRMLAAYLNWSAVVTASWLYKSCLGPGYTHTRRKANTNTREIQQEKNTKNMTASWVYKSWLGPGYVRPHPPPPTPHPSWSSPC